MLRENFEIGTVFLIGGTIIAALLTTGSTGIIFAERFLEGAWTYLIFIPDLVRRLFLFPPTHGERHQQKWNTWVCWTQHNWQALVLVSLPLPK